MSLALRHARSEGGQGSPRHTGIVAHCEKPRCAKLIRWEESPWPRSFLFMGRDGALGAGAELQGYSLRVDMKYLHRP